VAYHVDDNILLCLVNFYHEKEPAIFADAGFTGDDWMQYIQANSATLYF